MASDVMFANTRRGEIAAMIDGAETRLCLTLGALAELEAAFQADNLGALAARFEAGKLSARDLTIIIAAGLRGAGQAVSADEVSAMGFEGGAAGAVGIAVALLTAAFGGTGDVAGPVEMPNPQMPRRDGTQPSRPFPGTMSSASASAS